MSFPSNHECKNPNSGIKKAKSLHKNQKFWAKLLCSLWSHFKGVIKEPFQRRTVSRLDVLHVLHKTHCLYK